MQNRGYAALTIWRDLLCVSHNCRRKKAQLNARLVLEEKYHIMPPSPRNSEWYRNSPNNELIKTFDVIIPHRELLYFQPPPSAWRSEVTVDRGIQFPAQGQFRVLDVLRTRRSKLKVSYSLRHPAVHVVIVIFFFKNENSPLCDFFLEQLLVFQFICSSGELCDKWPHWTAGEKLTVEAWGFTVKETRKPRDREGWRMNVVMSCVEEGRPKQAGV